MIRQAISCDICGAEKRQTNHWFVTYEQAGELRVSGWNSRHKQRPDSKHLCGQTCLHKLVDEFMAKSIAVRPLHTDAQEAPAKLQAIADTSLTSSAAYTAEVESSARLITPAASIPPRPIFRPQPELVTTPSWPHPEDFPPIPKENPRSASHNWRTEAWQRERERELRAAENRSDIAARQRSRA